MAELESAFAALEDEREALIEAWRKLDAETASRNEYEAVVAAERKRAELAESEAAELRLQRLYTPSKAPSASTCTSADHIGVCR